MEDGKQRLIEKRKYIRLPFQAEVKYKIEGREKEGEEIARSSNISPEGLCVVFKKPVQKGMHINIEIIIQELQPCSLKGEVVWAKTMGDKTIAGIKILDIDKSDKNRFLLELCDKMINELGQKYPNIKF